MRTLVFAGLVVLIGAAAYLLLDPTGATPPPDGPSRDATVTVDEVAGSPQRGTVRRSELPDQPEEPAAAAPTDPTPTPAAGDLPTPPTANRGRVELQVVDARSLRPVENFVLVPLDDLPELGTERQIEGAQLALDLPMDRDARVRIESRGYAPQDDLDLGLAAGEATRRVRVELVPATRASGVVLHLRDDRLQPVDRLRVDAFRRPLPGQAGPAEEQRAWSRQAGRDDGRYELPDLAAGHWRLELTALDTDDNPRALQTAEVEFDFDGGGLVERALDLLPGVLLSLELVDPQSGQLLGDQVAIRLQRRAGEILESRWLGTEPDGAVVVGIDTLPLPQRCRLDRALAPGSYLLQVMPGPNATEPWSTEFRAMPGVPVELRLR